MQKWIFRIGTFLLTLSLIVGCSQADTGENSSVRQEVETETNIVNDEEAKIVITISKDRGEEIIAQEEIAIEEGAILMDVLKENFDIEETGGLITAIEGISQDEEEEKYWIYTVNGEMAMVGANEYELEADDEVTFDLQAWEE